MEIKNEKLFSENVCKCCLGNSHILLAMWGVNVIEGKRGVFGDMITTCFALSWQKPVDRMELICERCVKTLLIAFKFKRDVLASEQLLLEQLKDEDNESMIVVKEETFDVEENIIQKDLIPNVDSKNKDNLEKVKETVIERNMERLEYFEAVYLEDSNDTVESAKKEKGSSEKNASSINLFDKTSISAAQNIEEKSDSSEYFFGTANTPSAHDTSSDELESSMDGGEAIDPAFPVGTDIISSNPLSSSATSNMKYLVPLEHHVTIGVKNDIQGDNCANNNMIPNPKSKYNNDIHRFRGKDFCFYCESLVSNFARHLLRHHFNETEVQNFVLTPKKSIQRKQLITKLRKKGNFIQNSVEVTKPMRKRKLNDYLPCTNCLGFYSKSLLWRHKKKCTGKTSKNVQSEAQNLLLRNLKVDEKLKNTVFPRMRADKISLVAKSDVLICEFGSQYLKKPREKHFVNVVSRKMRELAKILLEIKKNNPSVKSFFDVIRPQNYDVIVAATKVVGKYDSEKDRFGSPTFAMNISSSIKQCCNISIMFALKKQEPYMDVNTAIIVADLKTLIELIDSNWKFDISSQAATDLNKKGREENKITIIPLANDLKTLREYLSKMSEEAADTIKEGAYNVATYTQLLETVYCRVLLLNRCRPGELQRIEVHDYLENDNNTSEKYEKFDRALTASERVLVKKSKRVVIRGKSGRGVPVLFNNEAQEDIKLLLTVRDKFVSTSNKLLFGNPGFENSIYGYKVLERYSRLSGTKNLKAISSTRFRKYLATLSQMFSMTENDMEQLATVMGLIKEVHKKSYRLPDDVSQTAKLSKLLILMEGGKADAFRGKHIDEIDLDLNEDLEEENIENGEILYYDLPITCEPSHVSSQDCVQQVCNEPQPGPFRLQNKTSESDFQMTLPSITKQSVNKRRILVPWTAEQKKVVTSFFKRHIINKKAPKRNECETLKEQNPELLLNKDWLKIKVFVQNTYSKK